MKPSDPSVVEKARLRVEVRGAVQGVGFRPFVYRLASELGLAGWVNNSPQGAVVEVEGDHGRIDEFLRRLPSEKPSPCVIHSMTLAFLPLAGYTMFRGAPQQRGRPEDGGDSARPGDLLGVFARDLRSEQSTFPLSVHQLHELRSTL